MYVVVDKSGKVASRARVGIDWLPPSFDPSNFLTWDTDKGATLFSGMNGGKVIPLSKLGGVK